jgi:hypothetical protein
LVPYLNFLPYLVYPLSNDFPVQPLKLLIHDTPQVSGKVSKNEISGQNGYGNSIYLSAVDSNVCKEIDDVFLNSLGGPNWQGIISFAADEPLWGRRPFSIKDNGVLEGHDAFSLGRCLDDGPFIQEVAVERVGASVDAIVEGPDFNSAGVSARNWEDWLQVQTAGASNGFRGMDMGDISTEMLM